MATYNLSLSQDAANTILAFPKALLKIDQDMSAVVLGPWPIHVNYTDSNQMFTIQSTAQIQYTIDFSESRSAYQGIVQQGYKMSRTLISESGAEVNALKSMVDQIITCFQRIVAVSSQGFAAKDDVNQQIQQVDDLLQKNIDALKTEDQSFAAYASMLEVLVGAAQNAQNAFPESVPNALNALNAAFSNPIARAQAQTLFTAIQKLYNENIAGLHEKVQELSTQTAKSVTAMQVMVANLSTFQTQWLQASQAVGTATSSDAYTAALAELNTPAALAAWQPFQNVLNELTLPGSNPFAHLVALV